MGILVDDIFIVFLLRNGLVTIAEVQFEVSYVYVIGFRQILVQYWWTLRYVRLCIDFANSLLWTHKAVNILKKTIYKWLI